MIAVAKRVLIVVLVPVLLGAAFRALAFPFCFSAHDGRRGDGGWADAGWSDGDWYYSPYYLPPSRSGYWTDDYPPVPYRQPLVPVDVMPVVEHEADVPATPVEIPGQHIFR